MATQEKEREKEIESCSICHNPYNDPRLLPCLHSFCKSCLIQLIESSSILSSQNDEPKINDTFSSFIQTSSFSSGRPLIRFTDLGSPASDSKITDSEKISTHVHIKADSCDTTSHTTKETTIIKPSLSFIPNSQKRFAGLGSSTSVSNPLRINYTNRYTKDCRDTGYRFDYWSKPIKCPLCRSTHQLSVDSIDKLPRNTTIVTKLDNDKGKTCGQCRQEEVHVSYCTQCCDFLCSLCDGAHKRMAMFEGHKLILPNEVKTQRNPNRFKCTQHPKEPLEVYCITCKSVICRDCGLYSHNGHTFKPAKEAAVEIKANLKREHQQLQQQLATFQSHAQSVAKVEKHVTTYPDTMKAFITSHFDNLSKLLVQRKQVLLNEVDTQYNGLSKTLWIEKDSVEGNICRIEAGINFAERLISNTTDPSEVAVLSTQAFSSMKNAMKLSWNPEVLDNIGSLLFSSNSQDDVTEEDFIGRIGRVIRNHQEFTLNVEAKGYRKYGSNEYIKPISYSYSLSPLNTWDYERRGTFYIEAEHSQASILFPQVTFESKVTWYGNGNPPESVSSEHVLKKNPSIGHEVCEISFLTSKAGEYKITVILRVSNEEKQKITKSVIFAR